MQRKSLRYLLVPLLIVGVSLLFAAGCKPKPVREKVSEMDTPEHHVFSGMKLLDKGEYEKAMREFELAVDLDPQYSPAHTGKGIAFGHLGNFDKAFDSLKKGLKKAEVPEHEANAHLGYMRVHYLEMGKDWLDECEDHFDDVIDIDPDSSAAYYYMGIAYKRAFDFDRAAKMFTKVLDLDDKYLTEANEEWALVQKIQRAAPGTKIGKQIALVEKITKADVSALFIQELLLEKLYTKRNVKRFDTSFKSPDTTSYKADWVEKAPEATDVEGHVLSTDIETVLKIGVKGLEPGPDHKFYPDEVITRAEYSIMIEDILMKVSGDHSMATKFIGSPSPFPDLRSDLPYFNAVMVCTSRGIMKAKDLSTGEFAPKDTVMGADALLIIRRLKDELRFFE